MINPVTSLVQTVWQLKVGLMQMTGVDADTVVLHPVTGRHYGWPLTLCGMKVEYDWTIPRENIYVKKKERAN